MARKEKTRTEGRSTPRSSLDLETIVQIYEDGETWNESAQITSLSRNGAGFSAGRECIVGRLVRMVIPMPKELRAYDESEELYPVIGIVQHCNCLSYNGENVYQVGVALIGKTPPESFEKDPLQNYRICGMSEDGLWKITDAEQPFKGRKTPRFSVELDITIALIQADKRSIAKENTVTRNISAGGAAIVSLLKARAGDKVKFACKEFNFYALAWVRERKKHRFGPPTIHLEFIEAKFPVEMLPNEDFNVDHDDAAPPTGEKLAAASLTGEGATFEFERFQF